MLSAREAWGIMEHPELQSEFEPVVVAVIDTMIDLGHDDLAANLLVADAWDFVEGQELSATSVTTEVHGTHVAGIVAAEIEPAPAATDVTGIGRDIVKVLPLRVINETGNPPATTVDMLIAAVLYAAGLPNSSNETPSRTAQVISMSLGGTNGSYLGFELGQTVQRVEERGITVVAAAGNDGAPRTDYPAKYAGVLAVGSLDGTDRLSAFSNYGDMLDVVAPGGTSDGSGAGTEAILSLNYGGGTNRLSGTSMATPYVSGIVALMYSYNPQITPSEVYRILIETSEDLGSSGNDDLYGWGGVNAYRALKRSMMEPYGPYALDPEVITTQLGPVNFAASSSTLYSGDTGAADPESIVANEYLLTVDTERGAALGESGTRGELSEIAEEVGASSLRWVGADIWKLTFTHDREPSQLATLLQGYSIIERASPNRKVRLLGDTGPHPVDYRVLHTGSRSGRGVPGAEIVTTTAELQRASWFGALPESARGALEGLDFGKRSVIALFAGERPTGGYAVEVDQVSARGETLYVNYHVSEPGPGAIVTQALTSPYLICTVEGSFSELETDGRSR
jgi:hypothetical protein